MVTHSFYLFTGS